jgi:16S rRNA (guanine966-N2)-methyltransferase
VLVDSDRAAEQAIRANLESTGFAESARVRRSTVTTFLSAPVPEAPFDLVFLDPPYDVSGGEVAGVLTTLAGAGLVAARATVVVERPRGEAVALPEGWGIEKERVYGDTLLVVARAG